MSMRMRAGAKLGGQLDCVGSLSWPQAGDTRLPSGRRGTASCSSRCPRRREPAPWPWLRRGLAGKVNTNVLPFADLAIDPDPAAVELDEMLREREAEAGSLPAVRRACLPLLELLEQFARDPLAAMPGPVSATEIRISPSAPRRGHIDGPARGSELHRVREQVEDHLPDLTFVPLDHVDLGIRGELDPDAALAPPAREP